MLRGHVEIPARCSRQIFLKHTQSSFITAQLYRASFRFLINACSTWQHSSGPNSSSDYTTAWHRPSSAMHHKQVVLLLLWASIWVVCDAAATCSVCPAQDKCVFRVLALGDSLTRGAVPSTSSSHSYSIKMSDMLRNRLGSRSTNRASVAVTTAGEQQGIVSEVHCLQHACLGALP